MQKRYDVMYGGRSIGRAWCTDNEAAANDLAVTVAPLDRSGDLDKGNLEIRITEHITRFFGADIDVQDAVTEILGELKIEAYKITLREVTH